VAARLAAVLGQERVLRHPLLVTRSANRTVVLDGNVRLEAARQLALPDLLVQHIATRSMPDPLRLPALAVGGVTEEEVLRVVESGFAAAPHDASPSLRLYRKGRATLSLAASGESPVQMWKAFRRMVSALQSVADVEPLLNVSRGLATALRRKQTTAILMPPPLSLAQLAELVERGVQLPSGVLHLQVPHRFLGINLSLDILEAAESPADKAAFVRELVRLRLSEHRIHYYDAPVWVVED
jgi:hypothetical protein